MQPIDTSKLSAEIRQSDSDISKDISSKMASVIADKQRAAIGLLLKQTLQRLPEAGLLSVDTQKAILSAKNILPGEFTQLYIQDRVQQHKLAEILANQPAKPEQLTLGTIRQWFSGQVIQSIVYQPTQNGFASLLVNVSGQFNPNTLSQLPSPVLSQEQSQLKSQQQPPGQKQPINTLLANQFINNQTRFNSIF